MVYKSLEDAVEAAKKNDQRAFGFLYDECWDYIYGYVFKISKDERIAEELSLKTLSKAFDKIDKFNTEFKFKSWVITICKNLHIDYIRKQNASNKIRQYDLLLNYWLSPNAVLKIDYENSKTYTDDKGSAGYNFGMGYQF